MEKIPKDIKDGPHLEHRVEAFFVGNGESLLQGRGKRLRHQTQKPLNLFEYFFNKHTLETRDSCLPRNCQLFWIFCQKLSGNVFALLVCALPFLPVLHPIIFSYCLRVGSGQDGLKSLSGFASRDGNYVLTSPATPSPSATVVTASTYDDDDDWWSHY